MGQLKGNYPCLNPECGSSDAMRKYDDGHAHCFSCNKHFKLDGQEQEEFEVVSTSKHESLEEIQSYPVRGFKERGITKQVCDFFKVKVGYGESGEINEHYYPYGTGGNVTGYKVRKVADKSFYSKGTLTGLFGQSQFNGGKRLIITEGELDAMTVAQAALDKYGKIYPVVSIASATNIKEVLAQRDWIRSFDDVVLWLDADEPGQKATEELARIIGIDKAHIAKASEKDASDVYTKHEGDTKAKAEAVMSVVFNAKKWSPAGIISSANTWDKYKNRTTGEYIPYPPFAQTLNDKIYGRRLGSITLITSGTGMGKTSFVKEDQYHLLKTRPHDERIGVLSLEEDVGEAVELIMALEANKRISLPDVKALLTEDEERRYWEATMASDRYMFLDHQGSVGDDSLISKMEFMILSGCKFLYLDHITIAVSESGEGDKVNAAIDKMMSDILKLVKRYNVWICVISHLRKTPNTKKSFEMGAVPTEDDLKGSGALKQIPMQTFAMSRNKMEEDPRKRNTSKFWILKDRFTGRTGYGCSFIFNDTTGRLNGVTAESEEFEIEM
jgi:twinkle protein